VHSEMDQAHHEIDQVLTPQQRERFRRMPHPRRFRFFGF
jgi:Spy/CpxP family protein refolding chaperone